MSKVIDAIDLFNEARNCIECGNMALADLDRKDVGPLRTVFYLASKKIDEAIALIEKYRTEKGDGPTPWLAKAKRDAAASGLSERRLSDGTIYYMGTVPANPAARNTSGRAKPKTPAARPKKRAGK